MLHDEYLPCHFFTSGVVSRGIEVYGSKDIQSIKGVSVFQLAKGVANERGFIMSCTGGDL